MNFERVKSTAEYKLLMIVYSKMRVVIIAVVSISNFSIVLYY